MSLPLSKNTIRQRLIQWRNLKQLLTAQKKRNRQLEAENRQLKELYEHDTQKERQACSQGALDLKHNPMKH